jgi:hypothetical protein
MRFVEKEIPEKLMKASIKISTFGGKPPLGGKRKNNWMLRNEITEFAKAVKGRT